MLDGLFYIISAILMLVGISSIVNYIIFLLSKTGRDDKIYSLVCLIDDDAELVLREALENVKNAKNFKNAGIIAVDFNLKPITKEVCRLFCRDYNNIFFCGIDELNEILININSKLKNDDILIKN